MILLALGANVPSLVGEPAATLRAGLEHLAEHGVGILAVSPFYKSVAWPDPSDPPFVNAVARIETELSPSALLELLKDVERRFGRVRSKRNAPRTLDLDIVDFNGRVEEGDPVLPHPRMKERAFVLKP